MDTGPADGVATDPGVRGLRELCDREFLSRPVARPLEAERGTVARHHLTESVDWWREELTSDDSPFTWWWGTAAEEQATWHEVKTWLAAQTQANVVPDELWPDRH